MTSPTRILEARGRNLRTARSRSSAPLEVAIAFALVSACGGSPPGPIEDAASARDSATGATDAGSDAFASACAETTEVVHFDTSDGVTLEADLRVPGVAHGPSVVLLHMIPPGNDRTNYPSVFIDALLAHGIAVLNVDRRGAGGSTGIATEAYTGPNGRLDADAATTFLLAHACAFDRDRVALVGASNGTTTILDYAVTADAASVHPRALVYLTAGSYTENQHAFVDYRALLDAIPSLFVFATSERAFSAALMTGAPPAWEFEEYAPGAHGTRMFAAEPASVGVVADFLARVLGAP